MSVHWQAAVVMMLVIGGNVFAMDVPLSVVEQQCEEQKKAQRALLQPKEGGLANFQDRKAVMLALASLELPPNRGEIMHDLEQVHRDAAAQKFNLDKAMMARHGIDDQ